MREIGVDPDTGGPWPPQEQPEKPEFGPVQTYVNGVLRWLMIFVAIALVIWMISIVASCVALASD